MDDTTHALEGRKEEKRKMPSSSSWANNMEVVTMNVLATRYTYVRTYVRTVCMEFLSR